MAKLNDKKFTNMGVEISSYYWNDDTLLNMGNQKFSTKKPKLVDLFSGCGGISVGFGMAGFETLFSNDIHPPSIDTIKHNHPNTNTILGDIRKVSDQMIIDACAGSEVDIVAAGVPCQGFSLCNRKRHEEDERNFLFLEFIRVVELLRPKYVLLENVSGMKSLKKGSFVEDILAAIKTAGIGYNVECNMLNAKDFGVPQHRKRLFFVGASKGYDFQWPGVTFGENGSAYTNVGDAIGDLPSIKSGESCQKYKKIAKTDYQKLMRGKCMKLLNHDAPSHPEATIKKITDTVPGTPMYPRFKQRIRLHMDMLSPTQVSGGIRPQFQLGHPIDARGLTVRERCRLQSFPDDYYICGGTVQGRVQTGNAVPPLLAKAIATEIKNGLDLKPFSGKTILTQPSQLALFD